MFSSEQIIDESGLEEIEIYCIKDGETVPFDTWIYLHTRNNQLAQNMIVCYQRSRDYRRFIWTTNFIAPFSFDHSQRNVDVSKVDEWCMQEKNKNEKKPLVLKVDKANVIHEIKY